MKKAIKKAVSLLLAAMIISGSVAASIAEIDFADIFSITAEAATYSGTCGDNLTWNLDISTGVLNITGTGKMNDWDYGCNDVPWYIYRLSIKKVSIANGVTSIGRLAFYACTNLTSIEISDSVTSIGDWAFYGTGYYNNENNWGNDVLYIGKHLIEAKDTISGSYEIKDETLVIAYGAFDGCESLTNVILHENSQLTNIGDAAFVSCTSLTSITIPSGVTSIGYGVFNGCTNLANITFGENSQLTNISYAAFYGCTNLTSITFGENSQLTNIGFVAFYGCNSLTSIEIPDSVTNIGGDAFYGCTSLTSITFGENSQLTNIGDAAFVSCTSLTSITIPSGVTSIGYGVFNGCTNLANITFGENSQLTNISYVAFSGCTNLTSIEIPDSVTCIGESAFYNCTSLASVTIGNGVTSIGYRAFYNCGSLTSIEIPDSVTSIGRLAFYACTNLTSIEIPDSVTNIGDYAFYDCTSLTSIEIPDSVTCIGESAFFDCTSLTSITLGEKSQLINIADSAFMFCNSLTRIEIPDSVTNIGDCAFCYCTSLASITIPDSVTSIGYMAFDTCKNLRFAHIPPSVTTIGALILNNTSTYICSTTEDCYAKTYADANGIEFRLCNGHGEEAVLTEINIKTNPEKTTYWVGDTLDTTGLTLLAKYNNGTEKIISGGFECNLTVLNTVGNQTITVSYGGKTCTFDVAVKAVELIKIEVKTMPSKTEYYVGDTLDTTGLSLTATYNNGTTETIISGFICTPTVLNNAGKQIITVIYEGYVCTFEVTVNEKEVEIINVYATYIVDGEVYAIYELEPGEVIPVPVNPEKEGWTFNGWTPEIPEKISYDDMTFIAVFTEGAPKFYVNELLESYEYTGYPIMPAIDVYSTETNEILEEYVDYIINYSNNIDAGVARVEIVGIGDYDGEVIFSTFIIYARSASNVTISKIPSTYETGSPICVVPIVKDGRFALVKGVDFDLEYENNINPGVATIIITFKGNYSGTKTVTFEILEASERFRVIEIPYIVIEIPEIINEFPQIPDWDNIIVCGEDNRVLIEDTDYVIEYPEINGLGMAEIVVKGINDYEGEEFVIVVTVVATDISGIEVNYNETVAYTGNDITLDLDGKVICGNTVLVEGVDYAVEYVNNRNAGTMTVIIIGIGNYSGRTEFEVVIEKADISGMSVSGVSGYYTYNGGEIKPEIILGNLVIGRDYTVTYTNNVNIGTATVIINGIGNYTGEIRITFVITDASTPAPSASVSIISDITSLGYEETAVLETSIVWGDYSRGHLIWTSSDESVATVNSVGVVDVLDEGTVTITVKLCDINGNIIVDENGNEVADSIRIKCTMTFWQKIVRWFRNLFAALAGIFG